MEERIEKWLYDILAAIEDTESFFGEKQKRYADFVGDVRTRLAVERSIEIIGEAMSRILKADPAISITNARKIVDTRNYIIHGYDTLDANIIWGIIINHLPLLKTEIENLLAEYRPPATGINV
ncbi:MAG: DUF86 domain-containing protein [Bacteroidales bacterium]|jgi:uncharacterized protein with HEPN domain|nr:DUF86 domain-containing protein [Bacteroidales bacterium]